MGSWNVILVGAQQEAAKERLVSICCHQFLSTSINFYQLLSTAIKYLITFRVVSICCHPVSNGMVVGFYQLPSTLFILKSISDEAGVYHLGFSRIQLFLKYSTVSQVFNCFSRIIVLFHFFSHIRVWLNWKLFNLWQTVVSDSWTWFTTIKIGWNSCAGTFHQLNVRILRRKKVNLLWKWWSGHVGVIFGWCFNFILARGSRQGGWLWSWYLQILRM